MSIEGKASTSYWEMATLGFARAAIPFPLEHALERMKLESQKHPEKTTRQAVINLWLSQGVKGLYTGSIANFARKTMRETYHWPFMLYVNRIWKNLIPEQLNNDNLATNIATGNSMALVHASITLPLERLVIERITKGSYRAFLQEMIRTKHFTIYEGFNATWIRHSFVWNLFFVASHMNARAIKTIDPDNSHPYLSYVGRSLLTSCFVVSVGYPVEFLRNRILMEPEVLSNGTINGIKTLFHRYKWTKLYSGAQVMLLHNCIQTFIIQALIDKMNEK